MKKVICDPGPRNTAFLFSECREIYLLKNIKNINRMKRYIDSLLEQKLGCKEIDLFFERQIVSKNIYYEGIITGIVMNYSKNARISRLNAYFKNKICKKLYSFQYVKVRSKKILKTFPLEFLEILNSFKIFVSNSNDDSSDQCIISDEFYLIKDFFNAKKLKLDDIVDVVLFYLYLQNC